MGKKVRNCSCNGPGQETLSEAFNEIKMRFFEFVGSEGILSLKCVTDSVDSGNRNDKVDALHKQRRVLLRKKDARCNLASSSHMFPSARYLNYYKNT